MDKNLSFGFICQKGELEVKSALLVASLRNIFGESVNIHCGVPDIKGMDTTPAEETLAFFDSLNVEVHSFRNPIIESETGQVQGVQFSNKIFCLPENIRTKRVVFCDSDLLSLLEPRLLYHIDSDFAACQAFKAIEIDWKDLYSRFGIREPGLRAKSILDGRIGYPYFNSGFYSVNHIILDSLLKEWELLFRAVRTITTDQNFLHHSDQISLSLAVQKLSRTYELLPTEYNFPSGSLLIAETPFFAHYHGPEKISRDPELYRYVMHLSSKYKSLKRISEKFPFWKSMISDSESPASLNIKYRIKKSIRKNFSKKV